MKPESFPSPEDNSQEKEIPSIIVGNKKFVTGDTVNAMRSNGEWERDWTIHSFDENKVIITKKQGEKVLSKAIDMHMFEEWQAEDRQPGMRTIKDIGEFVNPEELK